MYITSIMAEKSTHNSDGFRDLDFWIAEWFKGDRRDSVNTQAAYRLDLRQFFSRCGKSYKAVTVEDIQDWRSYLFGEKDAGRMAAKTAARKLVSVCSFYKFLNSQEATALNLARIETPKIRPAINHKKLLTEKEVMALIDAASDPTHRLFVRFLYLTAVRVSEALDLRWRDLTELDEGGEAHVVGKGEKPRDVYLPSALWSDLMTHRGAATDHDHLFPAWNRHLAARIVAKLAKAAEIGKSVSPHSLRHAHISHALKNGATVAELRDQAGHASISTTCLYAHANRERATATRLKVQ